MIFSKSLYCINMSPQNTYNESLTQQLTHKKGKYISKQFKQIKLSKKDYREKIAALSRTQSHERGRSSFDSIFFVVFVIFYLFFCCFCYFFLFFLIYLFSVNLFFFLFFVIIIKRTVTNWSKKKCYQYFSILL